MSSLYDEWSNKRIFKIEADRFKKKKYIYTSPFRVNCQGFNNYSIYPYIVSDLYSKMYRMEGYNVLYSILVDNLNDDTMSYSRLRGEAFTSLKDYYVRELQDMCVGYDEEKLISYSDNEYIEFTQRLFKQMYDDGVVLLKKKECYTDFSGHTIYQPYMVSRANDKYVLKETGEPAYSKTMDVCVIDTSKICDIISVINNAAISDDMRAKLKEMVGVEIGMRIPFYSPDKGISLYIMMKKPEMISGISFVALNPKYMDIMPYVSDDEILSIGDYINTPDTAYDMYTGITIKNPLTNEDVYVFASYKYDEPIHAGIPCDNILDAMFASHQELDYHDVIKDGYIVNSDFLDNMEPIEARRTLIEAFSSEGMGDLFEYANDTEIIISSYEDLGVIVPIVADYKNDNQVLDEKFYPVYYSNRFKPIITNEEKLDSNLSLKRMVFTEGFMLGISNIYGRCFDIYGGNDEFLRNKSLYDDFNDMLGFINQASEATEVFYNILFNKYLETFGKSYHTFGRIDAIKTNMNVNYLGEQQRLGVSFVDEILNKYSADAYRFYLMADTLNDELSLTLSNVEKYNDLIDRIKTAYDSPFEMANYDNGFMTAFIKEEKGLLEAFEIKKYALNLVSFFEAFVETHKITRNESYSFLIMLSLIAPEITEEINRTVFKERYSIFYNEFPR